GSWRYNEYTHHLDSWTANPKAILSAFQEAASPTTILCAVRLIELLHCGQGRWHQGPSRVQSLLLCRPACKNLQRPKRLALPPSAQAILRAVQNRHRPFAWRYRSVPLLFYKEAGMHPEGFRGLNGQAAVACAGPNIRNASVAAIQRGHHRG